MTVFQQNTVPETQTPSNSDETVLDAMIRAGSSTGLGWEDVYVLLTDAGFKLDRDRVRRIVIPRRTTAPAGATTGAVFPQGHRRGT